MYLSEGLKKLPKNLNILKLDLSCNFFGDNVEEMKYLGDGLK